MFVPRARTGEVQLRVLVHSGARVRYQLTGRLQLDLVQRLVGGGFSGSRATDA